MDIKGFQNIIFDVDGVLIDSMPLWENCANRYLWDVHGINAPSELDRNCATLSLLEAGEYILGLYPQIPLSPEKLADGVACYIREQYVKVPERPGMVNTIKQLAGLGYSLYLATASEEENVKGALSNLGVWECFQGIYTCTNVGFSKSYRQYYDEVARRIGVPGEELVMVEDSLHSMKTAKEAGLTVVGVYEETSAAQAAEIQNICDVYLEKIEQLPGWLQGKEIDGFEGIYKRS